MQKPSFKINARMLLELGAELISSDGIALYELIKNSVDAGASSVKIRVFIALRYPEYKSLLESIEQVSAMSQVRPLIGRIRSSLETDMVDKARELFESTVAASTSVKELRSALVRFYHRANYIVVEDAGHGMSYMELMDDFLTIGTLSRRRGNVAGKGYLGEKGVGRLSTMRLGDQLDVVTTKAGEARCSRLLIDWTMFSHDSDRKLQDVMVKPRRGAAKDDSSRHGTIITIRDLRSDWTEKKFQEIVVEDFGRLIDPFVPKSGNRLLRLFYNGKRHYLPAIDDQLFRHAHATCEATFGYEGGNPWLRGFVNYRLRGKERSFAIGEPELRGITRALPFGAVEKLGKFKLQMWWFNRQLLNKANKVPNAAEIKAMIRRWSGGLMLYRGRYRINPYGGPEDDWLSLDKRAFSSRGFKLNRQQVVGRVVIDVDNRSLVEQTNREGLTDSPEKDALVALLQHVLFTQFKEFLDECDKEVRVQELTTLENLEERIEATEDEIGRRLRAVAARVPEERKSLDEVEDLVGKLHEYIEQARTLAEEYENDRAKFVYLAGVGLMVEFILHELGRATAHTLDTLRSIEKENAVGTLPASVPASFATLSDQLRTIVKRVDTLDPLSTSRRQQREEFDLFQLMRQVVDSRSAQTSRHGIVWDGNFRSDGRWIINGVKGMFIQIVENLISNSIYWLEVQRDIEPSLRPRITIDLDPDEEQLVYTDNGTGVDPAHSERIFEPFVSHRPAKDGKGLGLYISREIAGYHEWTLAMLEDSTVRPDRYNTFVLDLSHGRKPKGSK